MSESKDALDRVIKKSRVHLYKPIQIAEILYRHRMYGDFDPLDLESYRNQSKKWRDSVTDILVGRSSSSSQKFQDNLFEANAVPPRIMAQLCEANEYNSGVVESYIYHQFAGKLSDISDAANYLADTPYFDIKLSEFISLFHEKPGLRRSIDKIYEIVVYSLFKAIVEALDVKVSVQIDPSKRKVAEDFEDFSRLVLGIDEGLSGSVSAAFYRAGVTNAADRGVDLWGNFGPAVQIKHVSLDEKTAKSIVSGVDSSRIVIVCKACDEHTISSILGQLGLKVRGIVTEDDLTEWYDRALRGAHASEIGPKLKECIIEQIQLEFPSQNGILNEFMKSRGYDKIDYTTYASGEERFG